MLTECQNILLCKTYSDEIIASLRGGLAQKNIEPTMAIVIVGSLARREASQQSDLDYFVIHDGQGSPENAVQEINNAIEAIGLRAPSANGAFASTVSKEDFLKTIGGYYEQNDELTRRMLFMLESDWIFGEEAYARLFTSIIERYIGERITQHQLARFFLNDIIRYYRTICVDFEYKTSAGGKSWGDRNIKLMFSRKLLYFSGVLAAAETAQSACGYKRAELERLLKLNPLARVLEVCGQDAARIFNRYDKFLEWMADADCRKMLKETNDNRDQHTDQFREMKNSAHHFSWDLEALLHRRYAPTHPVYQALIF